MKLTTKSEYGLLAIIDIACSLESGPVSVREIAERRGLPLRFLEQIFVPLRQAGLVTSVRGARGGFVLALDPAQISVLDIVEAVEGPLETNVCDSAAASKGGCSKHNLCAAASVWNKATRVLREEFGSIYIKELADLQRRLDDTER